MATLPISMRPLLLPRSTTPASRRQPAMYTGCARFSVNGDANDWSAPVTRHDASVHIDLCQDAHRSRARPGRATLWFSGSKRLNWARPARTSGLRCKPLPQATPRSTGSISRNSDSAGKPYDSAADLTAVYDLAANQQQPFVVPAGTTRSLPIVAYTINKFQALLIAVDFSTAPHPASRSAQPRSRCRKPPRIPSAAGGRSRPQDPIPQLPDRVAISRR